MIGHGGPDPSGGLRSFFRRWSSARSLCLLALVAVQAGWCAYALAEENVRMRVAWGGGAAQRWRGWVVVDQGSLSKPQALGVEADEPGSMWLEHGRLPSEATASGSFPGRPESAYSYLAISQRSPRTYDGADLLASGSPDTGIWVRLAAYTLGKQPAADSGWQRVTIAQLFDGAASFPLDDTGNRLVVQRAPDDMLRVTLADRPLVFLPGETFQFEVLPHRLPTEEGKKLRVEFQLTAARGGGSLWSNEQEMVAGQEIPIPVDVPVPGKEGVYEVSVSVWQQWWLPLPRLPQPVAKRQPIAERRIQFVVLAQSSAQRGEAGEISWRLLDEIDPTSPKWWERLATLPQPPHLPKLGTGPLGNGRSHTDDSPLGKVTELAPAEEQAETAWEAYTLAVENPGRPHLLEIEYPSRKPQTLGVSIMEPNAAGAIAPIGLDSGVQTSAALLAPASEPGWARHRLLFWPRSKQPLLVLTNPSGKEAAQYGKIRLYVGPDQLPPANPRAGAPAERLMAGYFHRPLFPAQFSATKALAPQSQMAVDDWLTFYQGGTRLVEYLRHAGYGGLMISVLADGSTIYPSRLLEPTPRYDTGVFLECCQDPLRKDVLEMLFRMFDRDGLQLIPALEFATPLPALERQLRQNTAETVGMRWIGPEGTAWTDLHQPTHGMAPYYNVLDPRVQEAMLDVVRELVERYGRHPAFGGVAIHLSAYGYAQLLDPAWGMDDQTIARFANDTAIELPHLGADRFTQRAQLLTGKHRPQWLSWRAEQLANFYRRVRDQLQQVRPKSRLYLVGTHMFEGRSWNQWLQPSLPQRATLADAMLQAGVAPQKFVGEETIVLLKPEEIAGGDRLGQATAPAIDHTSLELRHLFEQQDHPGAVFFHRPIEVRLASLDQKSPVQPCLGWVATQAVPSGWQNRRRFVEALAELDCDTIFDGGWQLCLGQEEAIAPLVAAFTQLPAVRFQRLLRADGGDPGEPVVVRYADHQGHSFVYLVNTAPFPVEVQCRFDAPPDAPPPAMEEISGRRTIDPLYRNASGTYWKCRLEAYDLLALRFSRLGIRPADLQTRWPPDVTTKLAAAVAALRDRVAVLRDPPLWQVLSNPNFEKAATTPGQLPGWTTFTQPSTWAGVDTSTWRSGVQSLRMATASPVTSVVSEPFDSPATGRLAARAWFRVADPNQQPLVRFALEAKLHDGRVLTLAEAYRGNHPSAKVQPIAADWSSFEDLHVPWLPADEVAALRIRFDLLGRGEIWIDDVQLCQLAFTRTELIALIKLIAPAEASLQEGRLAQCLRLMEGYWPTFLVEHVPAPEYAVTQASAPPATSQEQTKQEPERSAGLFDRLKGWVPKPLRLF